MRALLVVLLLASCVERPGTPPSLAVRCRQAVAAHDAGRHSAAESGYRDLVAEGYVPAKLGLGILLRETGRPEESLTCLEDAGDLKHQAATLFVLGRYEQAIGLCTLLVDDDPITEFVLTAALWNAGYDVESWLWEIVAKTAPHDALAKELFLALADAAREDGRMETAKELDNAAQF